MKTKEFNEIVDLFCMELEKQKEFNTSIEELIKKIIRYSKHKEYMIMNFERDLELIKDLIYYKYIICNKENTNIFISNQIFLINTILKNKAKEYSKEENRLHNFYQGSDLSNINPIEVCSGYMLKHICSVFDILIEYKDTRKISLSIEIIQEKFNDFINYIILLHAIKKHEININKITDVLYNQNNNINIYVNKNSTGDYNYKKNNSTNIESLEYELKLQNYFLEKKHDYLFKNNEKDLFNDSYINNKNFNDIEIKIKKLYDNVKIPIKSTEGACGYDVYAHNIGLFIAINKQVSYYFGFAVEIPKGYALQFIPRSSICKTGLRLANSVGLIDSDYRGEVYATFDVIDYENENNYKEGDRVGQFVLVKNYKSKFVIVDELSETKRGNGGFGSTGK